MSQYKIYQIKFIPDIEQKAHILSKALTCSDLPKTHAKTVERKYFDIEGDEVKNCNGDYDTYYVHTDIYKWNKFPSKKWCIEQIKMHLFCLGNSFEGCPSDLGSEHIEFAYKLIEKHNL